MRKSAMPAFPAFVFQRRREAEVDMGSWRLPPRQARRTRDAVGDGVTNAFPPRPEFYSRPKEE
jgi:hypothetical protein